MNVRSILPIGIPGPLEIPEGIGCKHIFTDHLLSYPLTTCLAIVTAAIVIYGAAAARVVLPRPPHLCPRQREPRRRGDAA